MDERELSAPVGTALYRHLERLLSQPVDPAALKVFRAGRWAYAQILGRREDRICYRLVDAQ